eukprot:11159095-Lingulodinium_polyedra.AAC.1
MLLHGGTQLLELQRHRRVALVARHGAVGPPAPPFADLLEAAVAHEPVVRGPGVPKLVGHQPRPQCCRALLHRGIPLPVSDGEEVVGRRLQLQLAPDRGQPLQARVVEQQAV